MEINKNTLYVVATPIGNLLDVSNNTINVLSQVDYLFCEDTRTTNSLLNKLNINNNPKLIAYHKFNEQETVDKLINIIQNNKCALVSDAGYPSINDPGYILINKCHECNIKVMVIDGPCSIIHAIVQSGFMKEGFIFLGFIERMNNEIIKQINKYSSLLIPLVFLESIHRINKTINLLKENFPDYDVYIGRELTKQYEEYVINKAKNIDHINPKGEVVLIIKPTKKPMELICITNELIEEINTLVSLGLKTKDACKYLSNKLKCSANKLYDEYIKIKKF